MIIQTTTENVIKNLSRSEMKAVVCLVNALEGAREKDIVISTIADGVKSTRSIFVSVVRKLEACGVIHTESMGVKGLYVRVNNQEALEIIAKG